MQARYLIPDADMLPQPDALVELLRDYREVGFHYTVLPDGYLNNLTGALENHTFKQWLSASGWMIIIIPAVSTASILARKEELYQCAKAFRQQGFHLISLLYDALAIAPAKRHDWRYFMQLKMRHPRGQVDAVWTYYLHGYECQFHNTRTGQLVEVIIANLPECGCLDAWFFMQYIHTTKQFAELDQWLGNKYENANKALTILGKAGALKQLASAWDDRSLFAK
jgi:hypothetical protein